MKPFFLKNIWGAFGVKIIILLLVLFGGYYVFFLAPKLALPKAYLKAQEVFAEHKTNLVQNRIALVELARLSSNSDNLFNEETELLSQLQQTNEKGIKSLEKNQKLPHIVGAPNESLDFLNKDLSDVFPPLFLKERQILQEQQGLITSLTSLNSITADLLRYNAAQDLGVKEEAAVRTKAAKEEIETLQKELQKTQNIFTIKELIGQFTVLREKTLFAQFALIRSDTSVKLLTHQTNLILEYEFWLKQISAHQTKLATKK